MGLLGEEVGDGSRGSSIRSLDPSLLTPVNDTDILG